MTAPMTRMIRPIRTTASVLALAASLSACAAVGPNFHAPAAPTTSGYAMSGDATTSAAVMGAPVVSGPWWTGFGPPALDQVEQQALAGNRTLAEADATLARAQAELRAEQAELLPTLDANTGVQKERINLSSFGFNPSAFGGAISNNPQFNQYSVGGTASYSIDLFGGIRRRIESVRAQGEAIARQGDAATLTLTGQVASAAVQIAGLRAEIAAVNAITEDDRQNLDLVNKALAAGGEAQGARVGASTQLARDEALLPPLNQMLAIARHQLALLVGKAPADWRAPDFELADFATGIAGPTPVALPSQLVHARPDILQAEADLHAATANVGVATAALYPSITLSASLTQSALTASKIFDYPSTAYALGAGIAGPLFDGGRRRAERNAAREAPKASLASYEQTVLNAFRQVADGLQALANDDAAIKADQRALDLALDNLRLSRIGYQAGGTGQLPLVDAQRTANDARRVLADAQTRRALDTVSLTIAAGAKWKAGA